MSLKLGWSGYLAVPVTGPRPLPPRPQPGPCVPPPLYLLSIWQYGFKFNFLIMALTLLFKIYVFWRSYGFSIIIVTVWVNWQKRHLWLSLNWTADKILSSVWLVSLKLCSDWLVNLLKEEFQKWRQTHKFIW